MTQSRMFVAYKISLFLVWWWGLQ